jgi:creatinine amidohydrolase
MESEFDHHGGEAETSTAMAARPELVRMDQLSAPGLPQKRLTGVRAATPVWWYADYPDHYAGDAKAATAEKGEFLLNGFAARVAAILGEIKRDTVAPALQDEFHRRTEHGPGASGL